MLINWSHQITPLLEFILDYSVFPFQIEDLSQQAQVAAAEKFKAPEITQNTDTGAATVRKSSIDHS